MHRIALIELGDNSLAGYDFSSLRHFPITLPMATFGKLAEFFDLIKRLDLTKELELYGEQQHSQMPLTEQ